MGIFSFKLAPLALSAAMLATSVMPSQALDLVRIPVPSHADRAAPNVQMVQYNEDWRRRHGNSWDRRREMDRRYDRRRDEVYFNGHRGYRYQRQGYRYHNGAWFPLAAFATGAIIGGAIAAPPVRYGGSHVEWCSNRYRSYRAYDNTFQPNSGPRRQCNSPY